MLKRKVILRRYLKSDDISSLLIDQDVLPNDMNESDRLITKSSAKQVPKLCETRWSARVQTLSSVITKYKAIYLSLHDIADESCDADARSNALSYIRLIQSSAFIVSLIVSQYILSFTNPLCLTLQKTSCDILKANANAH